MLRLLLFFAGFLILVVPEFLKVYYIMPFPGSQEDETIRMAYMLHNNIWWFRILGIAVIAWPAWNYLRSRKIWVIWPAIVAIAIWLFVVYLTNFVMLADKMFVQTKHKKLLDVTENKIPSKEVVIGVTIDGESKAYPIEIIGYHHQVRDSLAGKPIMVTYCTVCRTGRVFSPIVDGVEEQFRLVGMDHFNAMFEDSRTHSWWRQVNGEAIVGTLKGKHLEEIPSEQMSLNSWIIAHPNTKVMQRDEEFTARYDSLALYDEGKMKGSLEGTDTASWENKSWVIGVQTNDHAKAYDWIETLKGNVVNDTVGSTPIVIAIEGDNASFHVWQRPDTLTFQYNPNGITDVNTGSTWNWQGRCVSGKLAGAQLKFQQAYQEYWHSWRTFRPHTTRYEQPTTNN
jgi:hypothetical protein